MNPWLARLMFDGPVRARRLSRSQTGKPSDRLLDPLSRRAPLHVEAHRALVEIRGDACALQR